MNLIELLKENKTIQDGNIKNKGGFGMTELPHLSEVLALNKQYRTRFPKLYGYNDAITDWIMKKEGIPEDLKDILDTQVYFSQRDLRQEEEQEHADKMIKDGWVKLTEEIVKEALEKKKKIQLNATANNDWLTIKIDKVYKPHCFNGKYGLMKPMARTHGYNLNQFDNAFCKLV